ncbi:MAG: pyridoxal phosphate-dependent aminotransferase, partial [Candidatus Eisenbacteria bacterium]|nr:pyridoxal phosphate-dependent aminotransferase [Candidatus Eisenbacteria bacterium]
PRAGYTPSIWAGGPAAGRAESLAGLEWIADLFLTVASPVQQALPALLGERSEFRTRALERIATNRARLAEAVSRRPELGACDAEGGWVAVLRMPERRTGEQWALDLLDRGVAAHPGHFYDIEKEAFLVVSLIVEPALFATGMNRLEALLAAS